MWHHQQKADPVSPLTLRKEVRAGCRSVSSVDKARGRGLTVRQERFGLDMRKDSFRGGHTLERGAEGGAGVAIAEGV